MEQHPIPQQISSYQFRLVGDMTLKQFFQLAGGLLVALIFYSAPLIGIIKWPFVITSAVLGVALAFLPLEERPLEKWIFAFFRAIYAPTEFFWKKTNAQAKFFQDEPPAVQETGGAQQQALKDYLASPAQNVGPLAKLEGAEKGFLSSLSGLFASLIPQGSTPTAAVQPVIPAPVEPQKPKELQIPQVESVKVAGTPVAHLVVEEKKVIPNQIPQLTTAQVSPIVAGEEIVSTKEALFSVDAAPPSPPSIPNVIVGQVVDSKRKIVDSAIMEIRDSNGRPVRALRSNKVGHFITVTPLESGVYQIVTEKDGYEFSPVMFQAKGDLIPPILVQGHEIIANVPVQPVPQPNSTLIQNPVQTQ